MKEIGRVRVKQVRQKQVNNAQVSKKHPTRPTRYFKTSRVNAIEDEGKYVVSEKREAVEEQDASDSKAAGETTLPTRRQVIRAGSLLVAASSIYIGLFRTKAYRYLSLNGFVEQFTSLLPSGSQKYDRIERYIEEFEQQGRGTKIPDFQRGLKWMNSPPLSVSRDLQGKVVILDFWTYCCINCMHVLPELKLLEEDFAGKPFTVVGVHSAKFDNEKDDDAIRNAVIRYNVEHPVVNDKDMNMWRALGISSWPSLLVLSPNGKVLARFSGEGHYEELKSVISAALSVYEERNELKNTPIPQTLERDKDKRLLSSPLKYPGKITIDKQGELLFISDSGNHRIVVCTLDGSFLEQIGGKGGPDLKDGSFDKAAFNSPQGLAYNPVEGVLYVADTENHALRGVDMKARKVKTLLGDGSRGFDLQGGKSGASQKLNSPWDVCVSKDGDKVFIAMAGQHQIWSYNIKSSTASIFSGNGYERNYNSPNPSATSWAQPSSVSLSEAGDVIYIADSESSSVRSLNVNTGASKSEAGADPTFADNLFAFGDKDGKGSVVRLQHPLEVFAASDDKVYIADSYNHKIKVLDLTSRTVSTLAGTGDAGYLDGSLNRCKLSEPAGLAMYDENALFIADTNNCVIRKLDLSTNEMTTVELKNVPKPSEPSTKSQELVIPPGSTVMNVRIEPSKEGTVELRISLPKEYHYTQGANSSYEVVTANNKVVFDTYKGTLSKAVQTIPLSFKRESASSEDTEVLVNAKIYYCKEESACAIHLLTFKLGFPSGGLQPNASLTKSENYLVPEPSQDDFQF